MNKKIKQLADKIWSLDIEPNPHFQLCLQAFAESIVQECESVSINNSHRDDDMGAIIARKIKQHFGVE
jgi:hypothetical protein